MKAAKLEGMILVPVEAAKNIKNAAALNQQEEF